MALYLNVGNESFQESLNSIIYVDKSPLIEILNRSIKTKNKYFCLSRPRRFGKSVTAQMICSYYAKGQDCSPLFDDLEIASFDDYKKHLNQYDVISINISDEFSRGSHNVKSMTDILTKSIVRELKEEYPNCAISSPEFLDLTLQEVYNYSKVPFVFVIDEWDCIMREKKEDPDSLKQYLEWLKAIFKDKPYVGLAYMTGILPVKKYGSHSALNMFTEYSMTEPLNLGQYIGFTENEVKTLCSRYHADFAAVKRWYDGYLLDDYHIYNPKAVVNAMLRGRLQSYWSQTGTYQTIKTLIDMNFAGLRTAIIDMLAGNSVAVNTNFFQNDMISFASKDDILTALIHLGYLSYDINEHAASIPNEEIRQEFAGAISSNNWSELHAFEIESTQLLNAVLDGETAMVANSIAKLHDEYASSIRYNDENSLSSVLTIAFLSTMQYYFKPIREFPTGRGFADFVYLPKPRYKENYPALIVELKWNKNVQTIRKFCKSYF